MMNKKAAWLLYPIIIGFIIGVIIFASGIASEPTTFIFDIGEKSLAVIRAAKNAEKILFYVDQSADYALVQSSVDLGAHGGLTIDSTCGTHNTINNWNNEEQNCYPDSVLLKRNLVNQFDQYFTDYLFLILPETIPRNNYDYFVNDKEENLEFYGIALQDISFPITKIDSSALLHLKFTVPEKPQPYKIPPSADTALLKIKEKYAATIHEAIERAKQNSDVQLSESLIAALIMQESRGDPHAISPTGCLGLGQACYCTAWSYSSLPHSPGCTQRGYSKTGIEFFHILEPCSCTGNACTCNPSDHRRDSQRSIFFTAQLLATTMKEFSEFSARESFTLAKYNGGNPITSAIEKTGRQDPSWEDAAAQLTLSDIRGDIYDTWSAEQKEGKVREIKTYVDRVIAYKQRYEELTTEQNEITAAAISILPSPTEEKIGEYAIKPSFKTELDGNIIDDFQQIITEVQDIDAGLFTAVEKCETDEQAPGEFNNCVDVAINALDAGSTLSWKNCDTDDDKEDRFFKICVDTQETHFVFDPEQEKVVKKPITIKFALYFPENESLSSNT